MGALVMITSQSHYPAYPSLVAETLLILWLRATRSGGQLPITSWRSRHLIKPSSHQGVNGRLQAKGGFQMDVSLLFSHASTLTYHKSVILPSIRPFFFFLFADPFSYFRRPDCFFSPCSVRFFLSISICPNTDVSIHRNM